MITIAARQTSSTEPQVRIPFSGDREVTEGDA